MGRTVPSFRIAEAQEAAEWRAFRRALPKRERLVFDELLSEARLYTSASSAAVRTSRFEGMAMAIIFHHYRLLVGCAEELLDWRIRADVLDPAQESRKRGCKVVTTSRDSEEWNRVEGIRRLEKPRAADLPADSYLGLRSENFRPSPSPG